MPIAIIGMHRSGTSMVMRLLNCLGVYLGADETLMKPSPVDNPAGYWEVQAIADLNDDLLKTLGGTWENPPPTPIGWSQRPEFQPFYERAQTLLAPYAEHERWGWKDPRLMLTLEFWRSVVPDLKLILCLRNPLEVARSMSADRPMRHLQFEQALNLWLRYHEQLLQSVNPSDLIITHYESYRYDSAAELRRMMALLNLPFTGENTRTALETIQFDLRHYQQPTFVLEQGFVSDELRQMYQDLCVQAGSVFAQSRANPDYQLESVTAFAQSMIKEVEQLEQMKTENRKLTATTAELQEALALKDSEADTLRAEVASLEYTLQKKAEHIDSIQNDLARATQHAEAERAELSHALEQAETDQRALQAALDDLATIRRSLIYRAVAQPVWSLRRKIAPENSRGYTFYRTIRRSLRLGD